MILNRSNFTKYYTINLATYITFCNTYYFSIYLGVILHKLKGWWHDGMRRDCIYFMTRLYETGLHPFFFDRQDCIHFYDKMAWDRTASVFMTRWHETGLHPFLWQDCMKQDCILFYDKIVWDRHSSIFMTSHHKTGTHPFLWQAIIRPVLIPFLCQASIRPVLIHFT